MTAFTSLNVFSPELALLAGIAIFSLCFLRLVHARHKGPLPPGPPGIPLLGNMFQLDPLRPHPTYYKWATKYGPIFSVKLGLQRLIVLSSAEVADGLLVTRSKLYSSRPDMHVASGLVSDGQRMVLMSNNREFKVCAKSRNSHWLYACLAAVLVHLCYWRRLLGEQYQAYFRLRPPGSGAICRISNHASYCKICSITPIPVLPRLSLRAQMAKCQSGTGTRSSEDTLRAL